MSHSLPSNQPSKISGYDVVWETPGKNSADSMPLGNGELGINLWVEEDGDLLFYLGRNDTFSEVCQLCKAGAARISLSPNPFRGGSPFGQHLKLSDGVCEITAGVPGEEVRLQVFVDSEFPVVHVLGFSEQRVTITAHVESWREEPQPVPDKHKGQWTMAGAPLNPQQSADIFPEAGGNSVAWYHRNEASLPFEETIHVQSLEPIRHTLKDPLLHRTFGGMITGQGFVPAGNRALATPQPVRDFHLRVASPCKQTSSAADWLTLAKRIADAAADGPSALTRTAGAWRAFWDRSWVISEVGPFTGLDSDAMAGCTPTGRSTHGLFLGQDEFSPAAAAMNVGKAHTLQRYMQACAGRSIYPIKFNGSIFTVEPTHLGIEGNPDFRRWGDCHWWQNIRMPYHSMLVTGDFDLMMPLFDTYERIRPGAEARTRLHTGAEGLHFWETMTIWGTLANRDYGRDRTGKIPGEVDNNHLRHIWNQGLELVNLMLDYHDHTGDEDFLRERLLPMAMPVLKYFDTRFEKDANGLIVIDPTQSLETYWLDVVNDTPNVAGLQEVTQRLCALPEALTTPEQREFFTGMQAATPEIPFEEVEVDGRTVRAIAPAQKYNPQRKNVESPGFYSIWPFRIFGLGRQLLEEARNSFHLREKQLDIGWGYDGNVAALLGLTGEAARILQTRLSNSNSKFRWPAMWGPNYDWLPDQCHGGNLMSVIHTMLLQSAGEKILLLPAWPRQWDVAFKLHALRNTTIECHFEHGAITQLKVTPESRRNDIVLPDGVQIAENRG